MKRLSQAKTNPFPYSDTDKRYHTYDYYLRHAFGGKMAKIALDGGFTCPNRDGTCGSGGCIFCSGAGSGEFAGGRGLSLREQFEIGRARIAGKWSPDGYIAYFQPFTNTYAPLPRLRALYEEALALPSVAGLNIATRADCLPDEVIDYLAELSGRTVVTVELGLQTVHDDTALRIGRGHTYAVFADAYRRLRERAPRVRVGVHLIFGLLGENDEKMMKSVQMVADLAPDEVKLHLLYVLKNTELGAIYENGGYFPMEREHYVSLVVGAIERFAPGTVIGRLTGDAPRNALLAPLWSRKKRDILNEIDKRFYATDSYQGKFFGKEL